MDFKLYFKEAFAADLKAGFITAVVALPLAIAFAIASGVHPIMGLYTAVIAGILGSSLGGSRFSITGPTGAMTVIILSTVNKYGIEGLLLAGFLAGLIQIGFGLLKIGRFVKYIPFPVVSGFTAGIGAIIFIGQIANGLGLVIPAKEKVWETIAEIIFHLGAVDFIALGITAGTILIIFFYPRLMRPVRFLNKVPPSMLALIIFTLAVYFFALVVPQVGDIPRGLPEIKLVNFNFSLMEAVLPAAFTIALLGAIEALLCAVVCDAMTNTKHNSNKELLAQGISNVVLPFFNSIPCTAAIARSGVVIREGAKTRIAGVIHAIFILLTILFLAPVAKYIPKAFLAGVLMVVSIRMINVHEFKTIFKISFLDSAVLLITFGLTVFTDLVFAVEVGMLFAVVLLFIRLTNVIDVTHMKDYHPRKGINAMIYANPKLRDIVNVYTIHGPFFFGAMNLFEKKINEHIQESRQIIILKMKYVPFIDSSGVIRLNDFIKEEQRKKRVVLLADLTPTVQQTLHKNDEFCSLMNKEHIFPKTKEALTYVEKNLHKLIINGE